MTIAGLVEPHRKRGKKLGFPTANIPVAPEAKEGIFAAYTLVEGRELPSLAFIGAAETFDETEKQCEVYILDYNGNLYGKEIEVDLMKKLRGNKKFGSTQELLMQMRDDETKAREYFRKH